MSSQKPLILKAKEATRAIMCPYLTTNVIVAVIVRNGRLVAIVTPHSGVECSLGVSETGI
jgi:hypothetical protein